MGDEAADRLRELSRVTQAAGTDKPALDKGLRGLFQTYLPAGNEIIDRTEFEADRRRFYSLVRATARPFETTAWKVRSSALRLHGPAGHWGEIVFRSEVHGRPLPVDMYAGVLSPYLMRINRLDPEKPPPPLRFDVTLAWQVGIEYAASENQEPPALDLSDRYWPERPIIIGHKTAPAWLSATLSSLVAMIEPLCSDLAMRDWLVEMESSRPDSVRDAALLTRHLGLDDQLPALIELAERAQEGVDRRLRLDGQRVSYQDRGRNRMMWSHRRFLKFLGEAPI